MDWMLSFLGLLCGYLLGRKIRLGWLVALAANISWSFYAVYSGQYGFLVAEFFYIILNVKGYINWGKEDLIFCNICLMDAKRKVLVND